MQYIGLHRVWFLLCGILGHSVAGNVLNLLACLYKMNISDVKCLKSRIKLLLGGIYKKLKSRHGLRIVYRCDDYFLYMSR